MMNQHATHNTLSFTGVDWSLFFVSCASCIIILAFPFPVIKAAGVTKREQPPLKAA